MSGPHSPRRDHEPSWALRLPYMLAVAALTSCLLSAVERPPTRARTGPVAVRVSGLDEATGARLRAGLVELERRVSDLRGSLAAGDAAAWAEGVRAFDAPLPGWEPWPALRAGGGLDLAGGGHVRAWPDTTATGLELVGLDPLRGAGLARARLERAAATARGLAHALLVP